MKRIDDASIRQALELNNSHAIELSLQSLESFRALINTAFHANWNAGQEGFLIAFDEGASYRSPNFLWFRERYSRFVYIDRVVVSIAHRGRGVARRLYEDLFCQAVRHRRSLIVCEVNFTPPNPASEAFHSRLGFSTVGTATLSDPPKVVQYLAKELNAAPFVPCV